MERKDERPLSGQVRVQITYCAHCNFLPRAAWTAQEILHTFREYVTELSLIPGGGGVFDFALDGELVFSRKAEGRYPEIRELKDAVRQRLE